MLLHGLVAALLGVAARPPLPVDPEGDPLALKDPFLELSGEELRTKWSLNANVEPAEPGDAELLSTPRPADSTLAARLSALDALRETVYVDVRLVGFDGDGEHELRMSEEVLQRLLTAASHEEAQHVVNPRPSAPHALPVRRRILYKVTKAQPALATRVARAVELHAGERGGPVPLSAVDEIVRADYTRTRVGSHVTFYLLNPRSPRRARASRC